MTSVGVPESKPVELLKLMPAGNVPVRLYETIDPPMLLMLYVFAVDAAVTESIVNDELVSVIRGGSTAAMKLVAEFTVPPGAVTAITPVELPELVMAVICVLLFTVKLATLLPPIVTFVAPVNPVPVMTTLVPGTPVEGVKLVKVMPLAAGGTKVNSSSDIIVTSLVM